MAVRILIADDEPAFRNLTAAALRKVGYECVCVEHAQAAANALAGGGYDLLITDIHMPGMTGIEMLQATRAGSTLPVIVVTAKPQVDTAVDALRLGVVDYLTKPVAVDLLRERVGKAVEKSKTLDSVRQAHALLTESYERLRAIDGLPVAPDSPKVPAVEGLDTLSQREREVVDILADGTRVDAAAERLFISRHTVRNHLKSIYKKLNVHSQVELLAKLRGLHP